MKKLLLTGIALSFLSIAPAFAGDIIVADVKGMVCDFCAQALKKVFAKDERVNHITVNLDDKTVTITLKEGQSLSDEEVEDLISRGGYDIDGVRRGEILLQDQ